MKKMLLKFIKSPTTRILHTHTNYLQGFSTNGESELFWNSQFKEKVILQFQESIFESFAKKPEKANRVSL